MLDVVVLTDERFVNPASTDEFTTNVVFEDQLVMTELINKGLAVKKVAWSDPNFDWKTTKFILFRTTWDYAERFDEFADWLIQAGLNTRLINSYDLISWNLDKHYLADLEREGVNIVKTYFVEPKDSRTLAELYEELGWGKMVLKPAVSAAAKDTFVLTPESIETHQARYAELIDDEAMMLQPFQESIMDRGELSLMIIGGEFTHAVIKNGKPGDFRVQDDYGGTVANYTPTDEEIDLAQRAVAACETQPVYARVDMVNDNDGNPAIMELEIIEPELWFRKKPEAAEKLALEVSNLLK